MGKLEFALKAWNKFADSRICAVILLLLINLLALGCSGQDDVDRIRTLNRGLNGDPESLHPHWISSSQALDVVRDLSEGLLTLRPDGSLTGGVARSWSVSDDGLTYAFELRPNAKWSNGERLTARHIVASLQRLVDPSNASTNAHMITQVRNAAEIISGEKIPSSLGVRAIDDLRLEIELESPTPYFLQILVHPSTFPIYSIDRTEKTNSFAASEEIKITNGAFALENRTLNSSITLSRNQYYWNDENTSIDRVVYHIVDPNAETARYLAREIDISDNVSENDFLKIMAVRPQELRVSNMLGLYYVGFNLTKSPFANNRDLRAALSLAIDRKSLVEKITGRGEKAAYSWVPPGTNNYSSQALEFADLGQEQRNKLASQYFEKSGLAQAENVEIEFRYNTSGGHKKIALALQAMWRQSLGIEATIVNEEFRVFLSNVQSMNETQAYRLSWTADYNDAYSFLSLFESDNSSNLTGYSNIDVDQLLSLAKSTGDPEQRRRYLESAERLVLADHPGIPIYYYVSKHLVSPRVKGWTDNVLDIHLSRHLNLGDAR